MKIETYTLSIPNEIEVRFLNYGGIIQSIRVPDHKGKMDDVVLGYDTPEEYLKDPNRLGAIKGIPTIDKTFWNVRCAGDHLSCTLKCQEPYELEVTYTINRGRELIIDYKVVSQTPIHVNLTSHIHFNLRGIAESNIIDHELWLNSDGVTYEEEVLPVRYPFDFRHHKRIGLDIEKIPGGYDHNFVLNDVPLYEPKARLRDPVSGRMLEVLTTEPYLQFYSGNYLDGSIKGKNGVPYQKHAGLCLEPNHPLFKKTLLEPGVPFYSKTIYKFTA